MYKENLENYVVKMNSCNDMELIGKYEYIICNPHFGIGICSNLINNVKTYFICDCRNEDIHIIRAYSKLDKVMLAYNALTD